MAKSPQRLKRPNSSTTTAKIKTGVYNKLVRLRKIGESISDVVERILKKGGVNEHKNCISIDKEN